MDDEDYDSDTILDENNINIPECMLLKPCADYHDP